MILGALRASAAWLSGMPVPAQQAPFPPSALPYSMWNPYESVCYLLSGRSASLFLAIMARFVVVRVVVIDLRMNLHSRQSAKTSRGFAQIRRAGVLLGP